jgi:acetyl esterase/lipase
VADWFAAHGVTAFVLTYRLVSAGYKHPVQLQDAQRAVRWVRSHAREYVINPDRIGMIGFSAGGHLTAMTETLFDEGNPQPIRSIR